MSLPGYTKLQCSEVLDGTVANLVQMIIDAIKSGDNKKVSIEIEIEGKLEDDGKSIELEVEIEAKEDGKSEKKEFEYTIAL